MKQTYLNKKKEYARSYYLKNKEKIKARSKEWAKNNPDRRKQIAKKWAKEHPEVLRKWVEDNKESVRETKKRWNNKNLEYFRDRRATKTELVQSYRKKWRDNNPAKVRELRHKRRSAGYGVENAVTIEQINKLIEDSNNICFWCDKDIPEGQMHLDHVYPLSKGGGHTISNIVVSCAKCNLRKSAKSPEEWMEVLFETNVS